MIPVLELPIICPLTFLLYIALTAKTLLLSIKDSLTGLYNRRYIQKELERAKENFDRYQEMFCIAMIDIDKFKEVNDVFGHQAGDEAGA